MKTALMVFLHIAIFVAAFIIYTLGLGIGLAANPAIGTLLWIVAAAIGVGNLAWIVLSLRRARRVISYSYHPMI